MNAECTGQLIAARRRELGLSQTELAEQLHVTDKAVSRWETGRGMPAVDSLKPLAEVLGLSVSELLSGKRDRGFAGLARELLADINSAPAYEMLKKLKPYEKDRAAIDSILTELQERISHLLREGCYTHIKEGLTRAQLIKAYEAVATLKKSAASNVNTMLLFSNLCSALKSL